MRCTSNEQGRHVLPQMITTTKLAMAASVHELPDLAKIGITMSCSSHVYIYQPPLTATNHCTGEAICGVVGFVTVVGDAASLSGSNG